MSINQQAVNRHLRKKREQGERSREQRKKIDNFCAIINFIFDYLEMPNLLCLSEDKFLSPYIQKSTQALLKSDVEDPRVLTGG